MHFKSGLLQICETIIDFSMELYYFMLVMLIIIKKIQFGSVHQHFQYKH